MSPMTHAYAAGLIDGEGCILIQQSKGPTYHHLVTIGMTEKALPVLRSMSREYGGAIKCARRATEKWDAAYAWTVAGDAATNLLELAQPFLILKQEQARIALRVAQIRKDLPPRWEGSPNRQRRWTDEARERCAILKRRMHELNAKGPSEQPLRTSPPPKAQPFAHLVAGEWMNLQADLFSDLGWEPYAENWPGSGMCLAGTAYALPTWEQHTTDIASSSSPSLPTPVVTDAKSRGPSDEDRHSPGLRAIDYLLS